VCHELADSLPVMTASGTTECVVVHLSDAPPGKHRTARLCDAALGGEHSEPLRGQGRGPDWHTTAQLSTARSG
jgi:hypothetical protein